MKKKPEFIKKTVCMRLTQNSIDYLNTLAYNKGSSIGIEIESIIQSIISTTTVTIDVDKFNNSLKEMDNHE